ncbi:MAG: amidohydrolase [Flavobacteriaceae bacterium]|nr:amidohydrolase [Flavobacteriaceae bacterium]|tara:strand:+ start:1087 stop:2265 length:1179 start_codon:yes stop_codon:yes gene_type:complete
MKSFSFKSLVKLFLFFFSLIILLLVVFGVSYYTIDKIQKKNNLMDIEEYSPISTLIVPSNPKTKSKFPFIDVHSHHWNMPIMNLENLTQEMDSLNMVFQINLSGSGLAVFSGNQELMNLNLSKSINNVKENFPERFGIFVNVDLSKIGRKNFREDTEKNLEKAAKLGAIGLKIYKNLGLNLKDGKGNRVKVDDDRLQFIWEKCAQLGFPVLIHSGEPIAFFDDIDKFNERWLHARQRPSSFRPSNKYPSFNEVMSEQYNMFKKNPNTIFINAHLGWYGNNLEKLDSQLNDLPNVYTEFGAVINELGRQPVSARKFFVKHQDKILFGKDNYNKEEYYLYFQVLETNDEYIEYFRKRHGLWRLYGLNLPDSILKKVYHENALKIFPSINSNLFK